jgi:Tfp pilus assembly protein PilF
MKTWPGLFLWTALVLLFTRAQPLLSKLERNFELQAIRQAIFTSRAGQNVVFAGMDESNTDCRVLWFTSVLAAKGGDVARQEILQTQAMQCSYEYVGYVRVQNLESRKWAEWAVQLYPQEAESWFWLARTYLFVDQGGGMQFRDPNDFSKVLELYQQGLKLAPDSGREWCQVGWFLRDADPEQALQAFLQCCQHGDFGSNGCYNAGGIAEQRGDIQQAIEIYRMSLWSVARQRADQLELQLQATPQP